MEGKKRWGGANFSVITLPSPWWGARALWLPKDRLCDWVYVGACVIEGLQFPVWDASPLIAPLHPDRSFGKYGEHTLSHAQTHAPFRVKPLKVGWETIWQLELDCMVWIIVVVNNKQAFSVCDTRVNMADVSNTLHKKSLKSSILWSNR